MYVCNVTINNHENPLNLKFCREGGTSQILQLRSQNTLKSGPDTHHYVCSDASSDGSAH